MERRRRWAERESMAAGFRQNEKIGQEVAKCQDVAACLV
jgi:hypothetical protein